MSDLVRIVGVCGRDRPKRGLVNKRGRRVRSLSARAGGAQGISGRIDRGDVLVIGDVECFTDQLDVIFFRDCEVFLYACVDVYRPWIEKGVASQDRDVVDACAGESGTRGFETTGYITLVRNCTADGRGVGKPRLNLNLWFQRPAVREIGQPRVP